MNPNDIVQLLEQLGARLDGPAQHVWELAVRQMVIEGVVSLVLIIIAVVVGSIVVTIGVRKAQREYAKDKDRWDSVPPEFFVILVGATSLFAGTVTFLMTAMSLVTKVLNPEWAALLQIANLVKK